MTLPLPQTFTLLSRSLGGSFVAWRDRLLQALDYTILLRWARAAYPTESFTG
jgi:hypothetical protein